MRLSELGINEIAKFANMNNEDEFIVQTKLSSEIVIIFLETKKQMRFLVEYCDPQVIKTGNGRVYLEIERYSDVNMSDLQKGDIAYLLDSERKKEFIVRSRNINHVKVIFLWSLNYYDFKIANNNPKVIKTGFGSIEVIIRREE